MARDKLGFWYRSALVTLKPPALALTRRDWQNGELLPRAGGIVVAPNHNSYYDPITVAHYLHDHDRPPRFLAKAGLFTMPVIGRVVSGAGQIPVHRDTKDATNAMRDAIAAVEAGECVVVYPEGTLTRDPELWPMSGKTGAARIALASGCPVIPMAHWGAHDFLPPYSKSPHVLSRAVQHVRVGPPVDLADLMGRDQTVDVLREATDRIMAAITRELEVLRNETAPAERFDARAAGVAETGNPHIEYDQRLFTNPRRSR